MQKKQNYRESATQHGFTLIELLIAVAIVAILAAVAFPSFQDSIRKGRRSEAFATVSAIQSAQERWRSNKPAYSTALSDLNVAAPSRYSVSISAPVAPDTTATGYVVVVQGTGSQAEDRQCQKMGVSIVDGTIKYAGCTGCTELVYASTNACWSR
jgi:type IV pilus assembly protein PilE